MRLCGAEAIKYTTDNATFWYGADPDISYIEHESGVIYNEYKHEEIHDEWFDDDYPVDDFVMNMVFVKKTGNEDDQTWNFRSLGNGDFASFGIDGYLDVKYLNISGPINRDDGMMINRLIREGNLSEISLEHTELESDNVVDFAQPTKNIKSPLRKITLPQGMRSILEFAFIRCGTLEEVNIPETVESIGEKAFEDCDIRNIVIPERCTTLGKDLFRNNEHLASISLPSGLTAIPEGMFAECKSLKEISIPTNVTEIKASAFENAGLEGSLVFENLSALDKKALSGVAHVSELHFPASMQRIGMLACEGMTGLKSIYCAAAIPPVCEMETNGSSVSSFGYLNRTDDAVTPRDIPVYVPVGTAELYRNATGWDYFTNFIEIDEFPVSGVTSITADKHTATDAIYDLTGIRVDHPLKGHIYIRNGKKIVL